MKREYGVICLIKYNGNLNMHIVHVIAENKSDAEYYAIMTVKAQGFSDVMVAPDLPNAEGIKDNGIASEQDIKEFENLCKKLGIPIR